MSYLFAPLLKLDSLALSTVLEFQKELANGNEKTNQGVHDMTKAKHSLATWLKCNICDDCTSAKEKSS